MLRGWPWPKKGRKGLRRTEDSPRFQANHGAGIPVLFTYAVIKIKIKVSVNRCFQVGIFARKERHRKLGGDAGLFPRFVGTFRKRAAIFFRGLVLRCSTWPCSTPSIRGFSRVAGLNMKGGCRSIPIRLRMVFCAGSMQNAPVRLFA